MADQVSLWSVLFMPAVLTALALAAARRLAWPGAGSDQPLPRAELASQRDCLGSHAPLSKAPRNLLPGLVTDAELAAARLSAASLGPAPDEVVPGTEQRLGVARG